MNEIDNERLVSLVIVLSLVVIVLSLASFGARLTGYASQETGTVNVTVETSANINMTSILIDFGSGLVNSTHHSNAILESNGSSAAPNGNWSWTPSNFTVENIGNVNVTLNLKTTNTALSFIGGSDPEYNFSVVNVKANSCNATTQVPLGNWAPVNTTDIGTLICSPLDFNDNNDLIAIYIRLVIPSDSNQGELIDTVQLTATSI